VCGGGDADAIHGSQPRPEMIVGESSTGTTDGRRSARDLNGEPLGADAAARWSDAAGVVGAIGSRRPRGNPSAARKRATQRGQSNHDAGLRVRGP
jgi:hypothetical protein